MILYTVRCNGCGANSGIADSIELFLHNQLHEKGWLITSELEGIKKKYNHFCPTCTKQLEKEHKEVIHAQS